jgi:hypothetical protein
MQPRSFKLAPQDAMRDATPIRSCRRFKVVGSPQRIFSDGLAQSLWRELTSFDPTAGHRRRRWTLIRGLMGSVAINPRRTNQHRSASLFNHRAIVLIPVVVITTCRREHFPQK